MSTRRVSRGMVPSGPDEDQSSVLSVSFGKLSTPVRITPRNSIADEALAAAAKETPYETLRQLASIAPKPLTPVRRASSAGPPSTRRSVRRTPGAVSAGQALGGSARRPNALTPHARAALRENDLRRAAALTPGKDRRRSGRQQRETPRDLLRALSRVLAVDTVPTVLTPQNNAISGRRQLVDDIDGPEEVRPRLSMQLGEEDEEDSFLLPPRRSELYGDEENYTQRSIELPRRAVSEQPGRLSRGSYGSIRASGDFGDLTQMGRTATDVDELDSSYIGQGGFDDDAGRFTEGEPTLPRREIFGDLRSNFPSNRDRMSLESRRTSGIRPQADIGDVTETSFAFNVAGNSPLLRQSETQFDEEVEEPDVEVEQLSAGDNNENLDHSDIEGDFHHSKLEQAEKSTRLTKKQAKDKISRHGIRYPSLPAGVVKKLATTYLRTSGNSKAKISKETLDAIMRATDWFFEQVSDDLGAYAEHARRKTIDESDVIALMQRQRQTNPTATPFALAQKYLPRELLQDLRMPLPPKSRTGRQLVTLEEEEDEE